MIYIMNDITYNSYGEIRDRTQYKYVENLFNKKDLSEEEKLCLSQKVRCYCLLIVNRNGLKSHISTSKIHKKRMEAYNISNNWYVSPHKPYSRLDKCIEINEGKYILDFK